MADENAKGNASGRKARSHIWWVIIVVYLALFIATGYVAFLAPDYNPVLDQRIDSFVAKVSDQKTRESVIKMLQKENEDHDKKVALANQAFNVVLGAILGFLASSAVTRPSGKVD